ncbi:MAG TPA: M14 family metallopeptidase, partial [Blastocatellia bacterium]|nr:M14 family metallopeptidase [Blastocatellia bacterium]
DDSQATANILRNTVVLLIPSVNPDGIDIVTNWYRKTLGTKYEGTNPPELYHHYTGHDNNRDWFMLTQVETQLVSKLFWREWFPEIVYDVHQQGQFGSRMCVPPFFDPHNPNIDPVIVRQVGAIGMRMALNLTAAGYKGVVTNSTYDMWWHGGLRSAPYYHNAIGILTEAASAKLATPIEVKREQLRHSTRGLADPLVTATNFPEAWEGGMWRPRDILNMELITCRTVLEEAATYRETLLRNFVSIAERAIEKGKTEAPYAYIVPAEQRDSRTADRMIKILIDQGIEVHQAHSEFTVDGEKYGEESYVILLAQPYRANVKCLFEPQRYPDRRLYPAGPAEPPYDVAGWTLPMQMGVEYVEAARPFEAKLEKIDRIRWYAMSLFPIGDLPAIPATWMNFPSEYNDTYAYVNESLKSPNKMQVYRMREEEQLGETRYRKGDFVFHDESAKEQRNAYKPVPPSDQKRDRLTMPRLALYKSWTGSMDEGWTRWVLEQFKFEYKSLTDADVRAGNLKEKFDVIILPDQSMRQIIQGNRPGSYPEEYTGGITEAGVANLKSFVEAGGVLVCLNSSSELAMQKFNLPVKNVLDGLRRDQFYAPGSIMRAVLDTAHPIAYGMPAEADLYFVSGTRRASSDNGDEPDPEAQPRASQSPQPERQERQAPQVNAYAFEITDPARARSVARYIEGNPLRSGWLLGPQHLAGKSALVDVSLGKGRVVLFGFRTQHRGQTWGTFKLLFNSILLGGIKQ